MKPPGWFCCGWWSPWCVLDTLAHWLFGWSLDGDHWLCKRHDSALSRHLERLERSA